MDSIDEHLKSTGQAAVIAPTLGGKFRQSIKCKGCGAVSCSNQASAIYFLYVVVQSICTVFLKYFLLVLRWTILLHFDFHAPSLDVLPYITITISLYKPPPPLPQDFINVTVDVKGKAGLEDSLRSYVEPELMEGNNR